MIWSGAAVAEGVRVPDIHLPAMEGNGREKEERERERSMYVFGKWEKAGEREKGKR